MYNSYRKKRASADRNCQLLFIFLLFGIAVGVVFATYWFYRSVSGDKSYSIGSGNRYMNIIHEKLYGDKKEDELVSEVDFDQIVESSRQKIKSDCAAIETHFLHLDDDFQQMLPRPEVITKSSSVVSPIVLFATLDNPVLF